MKPNNVVVVASQGILKITLNRPERLNLLDLETRKEILGTLREHESNKAVRCVVLSSTGRAFSAGADIRYLRTLDRASARKYSQFVRSFLDYLANYPKPIIGVVDGLAVGGGLEMLMTIDIVVASREASFGQTEINVGLIPGGGGSQRLPRLIGLRKAKEMVYTGEVVSAEEAYSLGLVNFLVDRAKLPEETSKLCNLISSKSPQALRLAKKALNEGFSGSLEEGLKLESKLYSRILVSRDGKEGLAAFAEKREPGYTGD